MEGNARTWFTPKQGSFRPGDPTKQSGRRPRWENALLRRAGRPSGIRTGVRFIIRHNQCEILEAASR